MVEADGIRNGRDAERLRWHAEPIAGVLAALQSRSDGLGAEEVRERLARYGPNRLEIRAQRSVLARLLGHFHNVLIYVLIAAGVVTALLGHWVDSGVIFGVVVVNALIGSVTSDDIRGALGGWS